MDPATIMAAMAVLGPIMDQLNKSGNSSGRENAYSKGQMGVLNQTINGLGKGPAPQIGQNPLYQQGGDFLSQMLGSGQDDALEAPLMRKWREQMIPEILARSGQGNRSDIHQMLARSTEGLLESFGALRSQNRWSAFNQALPYAQAPSNEFNTRSQTALNAQPYNYRQQQPGFLGSVLAGAAPEFGKGLGQDLYSKYFGPNSSNGGVISGSTGPIANQSTGNAFNAFLQNGSGAPNVNQLNRGYAQTQRSGILG
jgi:hypothetical protein